MKVFPTQRTPVNVSDHVTFWQVLRDSKQQRAFEEFRCSQSSLNVFTVFQIVLSVLFLFTKYSSFSYFPSDLTTINLAITIVFPVISGFLIIFLRIVYKSPKRNQNITSVIKYLESFWLLGSCVTFTLGVIMVGYNGRCEVENKNFLNAQGIFVDVLMC